MPEGESHIFLARDGSSVYTIAWVTAPSMGETDEDAIAGSVSVFTLAVGKGFRIGSESAGRPQSFECQLENEKKISQSGYTGSEYDLKSCTVPARARAFTRVVDGQRQMYVAVVFYTQEDENVDRFISSFNMGAAQRSKSRTR
jgi:hypothetical protein